jgi:hypothetical protein
MSKTRQVKKNLKKYGKKTPGRHKRNAGRPPRRRKPAPAVGW